MWRHTPLPDQQVWRQQARDGKLVALATTKAYQTHCCWVPDELGRVACGYAPLLSSDLRPLFERIVSNVVALLDSGLSPSQVGMDAVLAEAAATLAKTAAAVRAAAGWRQHGVSGEGRHAIQDR